MIKLHKKIISSIFIGLAVFGIAFQCREVSAQAGGKVNKEERNLSRVQRRDSAIKKQIEDNIRKKQGKSIIVDIFDGAYHSINVDSLEDFIRKEAGLSLGNYLVHVGSVELQIKVIK